MTRVGIIGCGSITRLRHAPEYAADSGVGIAGFFDPVASRAAELAEEFGGKVYASLEDLLGDGTIDAVSVCGANASHADTSISASRAGKHVLCEKPMAMSLAEARAMIAAANEAGKILMIGHNQRLEAANRLAKSFLDRGEIGRVLSFRTSFSHGGPESWSADRNAKTWFFNKAASGFGAMGDLGIHKADLIRWLLDDEVTAVMAMTRTLDKTYEDGKPIGVDDNAACLLELGRGAVGYLGASWTNYAGCDKATVIWGTEGELRIDENPDVPVTLRRRDGTILRAIPPALPAGVRESSGVIEAFLASIREGSNPAVSGEDGLRALAIVLACVESSSSGRRIEVER
jgi:predicted dehydrogenase